MQLIFTPLAKRVKPCFDIHIQYEHGDADFKEFVVKTINCNQDELILFINKFNDLAGAIEHQRQAKTALPEAIASELKDSDVLIVNSHIFIEPHLDQSYLNSSLYASMFIERIIYKNETGQKFVVTFKK